MTTIDELLKIKETLSALVDTFHDEIEQGSQKVAAPTITLPDIRQTLDRWEEIRSEVSHNHRKIYRHLMDSQDRYYDGLRTAMGSSRRAKGLHYREREAEYEIKNIGTYQILRNLEKIEKDLEHFLRSLNNRIYWLDARRREVLSTQKSEQYHASREYDISP